MDFTQNTYKLLLQSLQKKFLNFHTFKDFIHHSINPSLHQSIILRHDVDRLPQNSLTLAQLEHSLGIKGTYYFRVVHESYDLDIMKNIASLGHEIGYHYEDVDLVSKLLNQSFNHPIIQSDLIDAAYESFCKNLELFRKNFDIRTICMHGSPRSKYDNKLIWQKYDYKELGIIGEPYYDIDFNEFAYFTDTGRRWNGNNVSVRDKVNSKFKYNFRTTQQIIENIDNLPDKVMFTIHPERWHDSALLWTKELIWQNTKNIIKRIIASNQKNSL